MPIKVVVKRNRYFDSVSLMAISTRANRIDGIKQAVVAMGTEMNKGVLRNVGLATAEVLEAHGGDLLIVVEAADQSFAIRRPPRSRAGSNGAMLPRPVPARRLSAQHWMVPYVPCPMRAWRSSRSLGSTPPVRRAEPSIWAFT